VVLGDARLSLAGESSRSYGLIVLDAFSSDSIPIHLITSEAISLYLKRLTPGGVLAFHISSRHLMLAAVLGRLAREHGLDALRQRHVIDAEDSDDGKLASQWVVMARSPTVLRPLTEDARWTALQPGPSTPLWTDDFSNILGVIDL
jgi:hypothetical protein